MGLFGYILHGFGFTLGARAADEALGQLGKIDDPGSPAESERAKRARAEAKTKERLGRERTREKARQDREIAAELARLKKRVSQGR
jgi:hypothetical protein